MNELERAAELVKEIQQIVKEKLREVAQIPHGPESGRRLQLAADQEGQIQAMIAALLIDIGTRLGPHFLRQTPAIMLEQFAIMSITRNEDAAGLLKSLINSFMVAYITPETSGHAVAHLEGIEALRAEIAAMRQSNHQQPSGKVLH